MSTNDKLTTAEVAEIFRALRQLKRQHEDTMNKDELAELLISAAILHKFDMGKRITGTLAKLEMNKRHAGIILARLTDVKWRRGEDAKYSLIVQALPEIPRPHLDPFDWLAGNDARA